MYHDVLQRATTYYNKLQRIQRIATYYNVPQDPFRDKNSVKMVCYLCGHKQTARGHVMICNNNIREYVRMC